MMYAWWHTKMVFEGLTKKYPDEVPVTLARSGWVSACMCSRARACIHRCTSECFVDVVFPLYTSTANLGL